MTISRASLPESAAAGSGNQLRLRIPASNAVAGLKRIISCAVAYKSKQAVVSVLFKPLGLALALRRAVGNLLVFDAAVDSLAAWPDGDVVVSFDKPGKCAAVAALVLNAGSVDVVEFDSYPHADTFTLPTPARDTAVEALLWVVAGIDGPVSDAAGNWRHVLPTMSPGHRAGTVGGNDNTNVTINEGYDELPAGESYEPWLGGITPRAGAMVAVVYKS